MKTFYDILEVDPGSDFQEIEIAYNKRYSQISESLLAKDNQLSSTSSTLLLFLENLWDMLSNQKEREKYNSNKFIICTCCWKYQPLRSRYCSNCGNPISQTCKVHGDFNFSFKECPICLLIILDLSIDLRRIGTEIPNIPSDMDETDLPQTSRMKWNDVSEVPKRRSIQFKQRPRNGKQKEEIIVDEDIELARNGIEHPKRGRYSLKNEIDEQEIQKQDFEKLIIDKLKSSLKHLNSNLHPSNPQMPILYLILKGTEPVKSCKINEKDLRIKICNILPVIDVRIYQKFVRSLKTLDNYILV